MPRISAASFAKLADHVGGTGGDGAGHGSDAEARIARTVRFIQLGAGARFDDDGRPVLVGR
jgi:hypothetical protein